MTDPNSWNATMIKEFRENGGRVGGTFAGAPLLLLHSTGARSGQERVHPVMYRQVGPAMAIFASAAGADKHPDWYHNILANPRVSVEVGTQTVAVTARTADGDERERIWTDQKHEYPGFADYERKTERVIPVVVLEPVTE